MIESFCRFKRTASEAAFQDLEPFGQIGHDMIKCLYLLIILQLRTVEA